MVVVPLCCTRPRCMFKQRLEVESCVQLLAWLTLRQSPMYYGCVCPSVGHVTLVSQISDKSCTQEAS